MITFPKHHQLYITHNGHHTNYQSVAEYLEDMPHIDITEADKALCIEMNEIWEIQWYPKTPIGFYCVGGPTLEKCLEIINSDEKSGEF